MRDIAAMKLSAIADNGSRLKDFIDVAYLSTYLSLADMLQAYETKFPSSTGIRPIKGLTFFRRHRLRRTDLFDRQYLQLEIYRQTVDRYFHYLAVILPASDL